MIWILYVYSWKSFFKNICKDAREKTGSWGHLLKDFFQTPSDRISQGFHIVRTYCSQLPARSGIFCLLVEIIYWPCELKFLYPTIDFALNGISVKVKLPAKFFLHGFEWFCIQMDSDAKYVPSLVQGIDIED